VSNDAGVMDRDEIKRQLGIDKLPPPRLEGLPDVADVQRLSGRGALRYRKLTSLIDPIETAAFVRYIPSDVCIDQTLDGRVFHPENSIARSIRTDIEIPVVPKVTAATGITAAPTAENHYIWLAGLLKWAKDELGFAACAPPLIFRTNGAQGTWPLLGFITMVRYEIPDGLTKWNLGARIGLLTPKNPLQN